LFIEFFLTLLRTEPSPFYGVEDKNLLTVGALVDSIVALPHQYCFALTPRFFMGPFVAFREPTPHGGVIIAPIVPYVEASIAFAFNV
jgi:hypothetical protein